MIIREPRESDAEDTRETSQKSWIRGFEEILTKEEIENSENPEHFYDKERFEEDRENDEMVSLVAEEDGKVVGKIKIYWDPEEVQKFVENGEAELRGMYVHPDYWRQNIGTNLLENALKKIPENKSILKVEAFKNDKRSVGFYQNHGFEIYDNRQIDPDKIYMLEEPKETVLMKKEL